MSPPTWTGEMRKGVIELCVLRLLAHGPGYGYQIIQKLDADPHLTLKDSTLYLLLARLQREGLVDVTLKSSERGPKRRYFALNEKGRARLIQMDAYWTGLTRAVDHLTPSEDEPHADP